MVVSEKNSPDAESDDEVNKNRDELTANKDKDQDDASDSGESNKNETKKQKKRKKTFHRLIGHGKVTLHGTSMVIWLQSLTD